MAVVGGARFPVDLYAVDEVHLLWNGALAALPTVPREGTLLKERSTDPIYVILNGKRFHIRTPDDLAPLGRSAENVITVPDGALQAIPYGGESPP
jgi:hypothetical protein